MVTQSSTSPELSETTTDTEVSVKSLVSANPSSVREQHSKEIAEGKRFAFGQNWAAFLSTLTDEKIDSAEASLREMLDVDSLEGMSFLDIGSGSGLFSLAARRMGARVYSFDFDTNSYECTLELRRRYFPNTKDWTVEQGSVLNRNYIESLGKFDIVYSWGVLHHTGRMWEALDNASVTVKPGGSLFIAIYNDAGSKSDRWVTKKRIYCSLPELLKTPYAVVVSMPEELRRLIRRTLDGNPLDYFREWINYRNQRGMSKWHDIIDWIGGYPYEFAGVTAIFNFYRARGYTLVAIRSDNVGIGCNEFVFRLTEKADSEKVGRNNKKN